MFWSWVILIGSLLSIAISISSLPEGHIHRGVRIPALCEVPLILLYSIVACLALRAILRGEGKPKKIEYSDQDVAKAKTVLDRQYFKKYGKLPEYPLEAQEGEAQGPEADAAKPERKA